MLRHISTSAPLPLALLTRGVASLKGRLYVSSVTILMLFFSSHFTRLGFVERPITLFMLRMATDFGHSAFGTSSSYTPAKAMYVQSLMSGGLAKLYVYPCSKEGNWPPIPTKTLLYFSIMGMSATLDVAG